LGQKGTAPLSFFQLFRMRAKERAIRIIANPKGRNPGPGRLALPMDKDVELQAVTTPMARRTYPATLSHFSMVLHP
jgi:hypothetical protein